MATFSNSGYSGSPYASPLYHTGETVSKSRTGANATALATYETFKALPSPQQPYTQYDFSILADIIRTAEFNAARARLKGTGSGLMTLQVVLKAYEAVLPKYGVSPDHDTYFYRLLLKLSLDSHPDWWGKLNREALATGRRPFRASSPLRSPSPSTGHTASSPQLRRHGSPSPIRPRALAGSMQRPTGTSPARSSRRNAGSSAHGRQAAASGSNLLAGFSFPRVSNEGLMDASIGWTDTAGMAPKRHSSAGMDAGSDPNGTAVFGSMHRAYPAPAQPPIPSGSVLYPYGPTAYDPRAAASTMPSAQWPEPPWLAALDDPIDSSEAEAYMSFRRMARAFRAWRTNSYLLKHSRMERDMAVRNWTIATAFWEVHLLQRCFWRWRSWRHDTLRAALNVWTHNSLRQRFGWWLMWTVHLRACMQDALQHNQRSLFRRWRIFAHVSQHKGIQLHKALACRHGMSMRGSFAAWRAFVQEGHACMEAASHLLQSLVLRNWHRAARQQRVCHAAGAAIERAGQLSLVLNVLQQWRRRRVWHNTFTNKMRAVLDRMCNTVLNRALNKWMEAVQMQRYKKAQLKHAMTFWTNRALVGVWNQWCEAVAKRAESILAADAHARKVLRPLLVAAYWTWCDWCKEHRRKGAIAARARAQVQRSRVKHVLRAWNEQLWESKGNHAAFRAVFGNEVQRLMLTGVRRWRKENLLRQQGLMGREEIAQGCTRRCIRHWRVLASFRRQRALWRAACLKEAQRHRKLRIFSALRITAALSAEQGRLVACGRRASAHRSAVRVLHAWRGRVLHSARKRMMMLSALLHWERVRYLCVLQGWALRVSYWRMKRHMQMVGIHHYQVRLMDIAFRMLLGEWQGYQSQLSRALLLHSQHNDVLKRCIIGEWRSLVAWLQFVNHNIRKALAHWRSRCIGSAFYGWYALTLHRLDLKRSISLAVHHARRSRLTSCLHAWRARVGYKVGLALREQGYRALRAERLMENALLLLRANNVRKKRSRAARMHHDRVMMRTALHGWAARVLLSEHLKQTLRKVAHEINQELLRAAVYSLQEFADYNLYRKGLLRMALQYWRMQHVRRAFDMLRWHALRRSMKRALLVRGRGAMAGRAMSAWKEEALYRAMLRRKYGLVLGNKKYRAMHGAFSSWRDYLGDLQDKEERARHILLRWRNRDAASALDALRHHVGHRRAKRMAVGAWRSRRAHEVLRGWHEATRMQAAMEMWTGNTLKSTFQRWRGHAWRNRHLGAAMREVAGRWKHLHASRALMSWKDWTSERARLKMVAKQVLSRMRNSSMGTLFGNWQRYTTRMSRLKHILSRVFMRSIALAFYGWRDVALEARYWRGVHGETQEILTAHPDLHDRALYVAIRWNAWPLSLAFYTWYDKTQYFKYLRAKASAAVFMYAGGLARRAFYAWAAYAVQQRIVRSKLGRALLAVGGLKKEMVFYRWLQSARYLHSLRGALEGLQQKVFGRSLREAFMDWRHNAHTYQRLKGVLRRMQQRTLSAAWQSWLEAVDQRHSVEEKLRVVLKRWQNQAASQALNAWHDFVSRRCAGRRMALMLLGRLVDCAWVAWREAVAMGAEERGEALFLAILRRRAFRGWVRWVAESRRHAALHTAMHQRVALHVLSDWRRQYLVKAAVTRLYMWRAFYSWLERVQHLRDMRSKAWAVGRMLFYGSLTRTFVAWFQYSQAMRIKRIVFARKQRAIQEALRIGDGIARQRNRDLLVACFSAWHFQVGVFKRVSSRMLSLMARNLATSFKHWRQCTQDKRVLLNKQLGFVARRLVHRPFKAWRGMAAEATQMRQEQNELAEEHAAYSARRAAFNQWRSHVALTHRRRTILKRAFAAVAAAEARDLKSKALAAWVEWMDSRVNLYDMVDFASGKRRARMLGEAFDVWLQYTRAMRAGELDPSSPYLSPRDHHSDRRLIRRMAVIAGNPQVDAGSDASSDVLHDVYESPSLRAAQDRAQRMESFLALTQRVRPGGMAGGFSSRPTSPSRAAPRSALRGRVSSAAGAHPRISAAGSSSSSGTGHSSGSQDSFLAPGVDLAPQAAALAQAIPGSLSRRSAQPAWQQAPPTPSASSTYGQPHVHYSMQYAPTEDTSVDVYAMQQLQQVQVQSFSGFMPPPTMQSSRPAQTYMPSMPMPAMGQSTPAMASAHAPRRIEFTSAMHSQRAALGPYGGPSSGNFAGPRQSAGYVYGTAAQPAMMGAGGYGHGVAMSDPETASSTGTSELGGPSFPRTQPGLKGGPAAFQETQGLHPQGARRGSSPGRPQPAWMASGMMFGLGQRRGQPAAQGSAGAASSILSNNRLPQ